MGTLVISVTTHYVTLLHYVTLHYTVLPLDVVLHVLSVLLTLCELLHHI